MCVCVQSSVACFRSFAVTSGSGSVCCNQIETETETESTRGRRQVVCVRVIDSSSSLERFVLYCCQDAQQTNDNVGQQRLRLRL